MKSSSLSRESRQVFPGAAPDWYIAWRTVAARSEIAGASSLREWMSGGSPLHNGLNSSSSQCRKPQMMRVCWPPPPTSHSGIPSFSTAPRSTFATGTGSVDRSLAMVWESP